MSASLCDLWWALALLGLCAGLLSGALGIGSGVLLVPGLVLLLGFPQKTAQGACLAVMVPMVAVGAIRYKMNGQLEVPAAALALLGACAIVGSLLGVEAAQTLCPGVLRKGFAVFLVVVAVKMFFHGSAPTRSPDRGGQAVAHVQTLERKGPMAEGGP